MTGSFADRDMYCCFAAIGVGHEIQYPMRQAASSIDEGEGEGEEEITSGKADDEEDEDNLGGSDDDMSDEEDFRF